MTELSSTFSGHFSITRLFTKLGVLAFSLFTLYSLLFSPSAHAAQPPTIINYQGKLLNSSGQSVTTTVSISLVLFRASSGGTAVYTAGGTLSATSTISITPTNGIFTISLGDGVLTNALPPDIFQTNQNLYLDVYIGSDHLSPRKQVSAVPYAYNAKYLDGVAATTTASSSTYIPISDSIGNFNFRHITSTDIFVSGTSTLATTTFTGTVTVTKELIAQAIKDALGYIPNQATPAKLSTGFNNGGFGGGATPGNLSMTSTDVREFDGSSIFEATDTGSNGVVFDGRYIYYIPFQDSDLGSEHGNVIRYDTSQAFDSVNAWTSFNVGNVDAEAIGFMGAAFDGRYMYLVPNSSSGHNGQVTRYDTTASFTNASSWSFFDSATLNSDSKGFVGAVFDGRYVYFVPQQADNIYYGQVTRYDTTGTFDAAGSWSFFDAASVHSQSVGFSGGVFDGRYVYFVPHGNGLGTVRNGQVTRYDTTGSFSLASSWSYFNTELLNTDSEGFESATFDGRYVYFGASSDDDATGSFVTRLDTASVFTASSSWSFFDSSLLVENSSGFGNASIFDGRFIYFFDNAVVRLDTAKSFTATSSWTTSTIENGTSRGAVFDGRYIYLSPSLTNFTRLRAYAGGVDTVNSIGKVVRSSDFFLDSSSKVGIGTNSPTKLLTIQGTVSSTTGISIGTGITTSSLDHERGLIIASTTANRLGLFNVEPVNGSVSASGTLRTFGGVTGMGISVSSTATTNTVFSYFTNNTVGNALVFDTNTTITSSTSALYSWRNNGLKLMSLSASGTLDVYGSISSMNASLGSPGTPGDLSERVDVKQSEFNELVPGDVLTVDLDSPDTYKKTTGNQTDPVMGVIATNPTLILGNGKTQYTKILTFLGRTNVKVSLKNGVIHPGDPLTNATDEPGKAMKQTDAGPTIGTALEPYYEYTEQNQGQILVLVRPGWSKPSLARATAGEDSAVPSAVSAAVQSVMDGLRQLGVEIVEGVLHASHVVADSITSLFIRTNTICLEDVCLTEMQLQELLLKNSINAVRNPAESATNTPSDETGTATSEAAPDQIPNLPASAPETTSSTP